VGGSEKDTKRQGGGRGKSNCSTDGGVKTTSDLQKEETGKKTTEGELPHNGKGKLYK